ncbi:MAG: type II toxin-antitoxin system RelE/ParE family toxin [candidate division Zixibacteria bacterium]|nr:type II toxin-antitoxin system RelE/ParE family toxin [candidate division Zixibacteria bacterium]
MWKVEYTKRFLKELSKLPKEIRVQAEKIVFEELLSPNPFKLGYLEHMTGYSNKYKIRIGEYRIGITMNKSEKLLICQRVAHRKDIYRIFP